MIRNVEVVGWSTLIVVSLGKELYPYCLVLVGSPPTLVKYRQNQTKTSRTKAWIATYLT